jgi:hypothetical protein
LAKTQLMDVQGKIKFMHAVNLNKFEKWSVTFYPTPASLEYLRDLQSQGLKNVIKKDDDGYYVNFNRDPQKVIKGKVIAFSSPRIVDKDGQNMDGNRIGRGSDATIRLEVYEYQTPTGGRSKAARWDSARIDNLIPWDPDTMLDSKEAEKVKDLASSPEPELW